MPSENFESVEDLNDFTSRSLAELGDRPRGEGGYPGEDEVVDPSERSAIASGMDEADDLPIPAQSEPVADGGAGTAPSNSGGSGGGTEDDHAPPDSQESVAESAAAIQEFDAPDPPDAGSAASDSPDFFDREEAATGSQSQAEQVQSVAPPENAATDVEPTERADPSAVAPVDDPPDYFDRPEFQPFALGDVPASSAPGPAPIGSHPLAGSSLSSKRPEFSPDASTSDVLGRQSGPLPAEDFSQSHNTVPDVSGGEADLPDFQSHGDWGEQVSMDELREMARETVSPMFADVARAFNGQIADELTIETELMKLGRLL